METKVSLVKVDCPGPLKQNTQRCVSKFLEHLTTDKRHPPK